MNNESIPFFLITGFLGSGKTSLLNSMLEQLSDRKIGLILNDFGSIVVDESLINHRGGVVSTKSLHGGQIFCDCLSGSFIQSIAAMASFSPDLIFVEASGLAKPASLTEIVSWVSKQTNGAVNYAGTVCVIDAERYPIVSQALKVVEEQVVFSDWIVLNKVDLVGAKDVAAITRQLDSLLPNASIFKTSYGSVPAQLLSSMFSENVKIRTMSMKETAAYIGWGDEGRPKSFVLSVKGDVGIEVLEPFVKTISPSFFRIKGFLRRKEGGYYNISGIGANVNITSIMQDTPITEGLVCIHSASFDGESYVRRTWDGMGDLPPLQIRL